MRFRGSGLGDFGLGFRFKGFSLFGPGLGVWGRDKLQGLRH